MTGRRLALLLAAGLLAAAAPSALAQCAMCKAALTGSAEGQAMAGEFNRAILLMLFAPYAVVVAFLFAAFRARILGFARRAWRRFRERRADLERPLPGIP
jgi:hypothetical protein